jgi:hypothetical protein
MTNLDDRKVFTLGVSESFVEQCLMHQKSKRSWEGTVTPELHFELRDSDRLMRNYAAPGKPG